MKWALVLFGLTVFAFSQSYVPKTGYVPDSATAIQIAQAVLVPVYGQKQIESEKPFAAKLERDVWTVTGTLHCANRSDGDSDCEGGTAEVRLSKKDARILSMIHYK